MKTATWGPSSRRGKPGGWRVGWRRPWHAGATSGVWAQKGRGRVLAHRPDGRRRGHEGGLRGDLRSGGEPLSHQRSGGGIRRSNAVDFGLQAAVFTSSLASAFGAVEGLEAGAVIVNDSTDYRMDAMPFGGIKSSGLGREGIRFALQEMTEPKTVCFNL